MNQKLSKREEREGKKNRHRRNNSPSNSVAKALGWIGDGAVTAAETVVALVLDRAAATGTTLAPNKTRQATGAYT